MSWYLPSSGRFLWHDLRILDLGQFTSLFVKVLTIIISVGQTLELTIGKSKVQQLWAARQSVCLEQLFPQQLPSQCCKKCKLDWLCRSFSGCSLDRRHLLDKRAGQRLLTRLELQAAGRPELVQYFPPVQWISQRRKIQEVRLKKNTCHKFKLGLAHRTQNGNLR